MIWCAVPAERLLSVNIFPSRILQGLVMMQSRTNFEMRTPECRDALSVPSGKTRRAAGAKGAFFTQWWLPFSTAMYTLL